MQKLPRDGSLSRKIAQSPQQKRRLWYKDIRENMVDYFNSFSTSKAACTTDKLSVLHINPRR
ncbi:Protein translocase subunit SecA [Gossypium arboreum]|uniref:Protein translocase subunit SecA n=1 Tax=Gossypium arboreum TaxID=29729 RepID=A0A0B0PW80_GOSAR|nr:Protein translocase subunit SecA [Gossypium arboreum]